MKTYILCSFVFLDGPVLSIFLTGPKPNNKPRYLGFLQFVYIRNWGVLEDNRTDKLTERLCENAC